MATFTQKTIDYINKIIGRRQAKVKIAEEKFSYVIPGLPEETFTVVSFKSQGGLNQCYRTETLLVSKEENIDLNQILLSNCFAVFKTSGESYIPFHGILAEFEQQHKVNEYVFYSGVMVPKLWLLTQTRHNQVFLDKTVPEILEETLIDGGLTKDDFEFRLQADYSHRWEYVCQFRESHYNFFSRWLEREGMYFFFETTDDGDKVIITDTKISHVPSVFGKTLQYQPVSGLEETGLDNLLISFSCTHKRQPKSVTLKDYNYRTPSVDLTGQAAATDVGVGEVYLYGEHAQTQNEAERLAKIRAEEIRGRQVVFHGRSNTPFLRPGVVFYVEGHYRDDYNGPYLVTSMEHEGRQSTFFTSGLEPESALTKDQPYYRNSFMAIPADVQYRPPLNTDKTRFYGVINAKIDAEGSGQQPQLDNMGRYKVILPFDLSGRKGGKASAWVRMAQPYAGSDHGMHFPLHKGTEVLLSFIDGDPDRPIISAAVPNPETPSVINQQTATKAGFSTPGGGALVAENTPGNERMTISQGDNAMFSVGGGGVGSENINYGQFICNYAPEAMMALGSAFAFDYSLLSSMKVTGHKSNWAGILSMLNKGISKIPSSLFDKGGFFGSVTRQVVPATMMILSMATSLIVSNILKGRLRNKAPQTPKLGYALLAEENGVSILTRTDGNDIAIVSTTGIIDVAAGGNLIMSAEDWLVSATNTRINSNDKTDISSRNGAKINTATGNVDITSRGGKINVSSTLDGIFIEAQEGMIVIGTKHAGDISIGQYADNGDGTTSVHSNKAVTLRVLGSEIEITNNQITINAPSTISIKTGANEIVVSPTNIEIKAAQAVKVNDLTVDKLGMTFKGQSVSLANAIKIN